jgi:hypothetical protein
MLFGILAGACLCFGQPDSSADNARKSTQPESSVPAVATAGSEFRNTQSLSFALDEGQATRGTGPTGSIDAHLWQQYMYFHFTEDMTYMERLRLILSIECQMSFSYKPQFGYPQTLAPLFSFYPNDAELSYSFGNVDKPWLRISAGYFPYKYNPDAKNLGEYLFRDAAYPTFIITNFEFPLTRELGFHLDGFVGNAAIDQLKWDLMLTSETHYWSLQDWTVSGVLTNNLFNFFELGVGASWQRLLSVNEVNTTPEKLGAYFENANGDSDSYTFRSLKLMARASINPMRFIPDFKIPFAPAFGDKPFFGKEDLKIYGELAVLGLSNYTAYDSNKVQLPETQQYYDSKIVAGLFPVDRTPVMLGINLPTYPLLSYGIFPFVLTEWMREETGSDLRPLALVTIIPALASGVCNHYLGWDYGLDVLSLEFEWSSNRFPDDNYKVLDPTVKLPLPKSGSTSDPVKYSLYFKKSFMNQKFAVSGLVGRDHMRPLEQADPQFQVTSDYLQNKAAWWWMLRLSANF